MRGGRRDELLFASMRQTPNGLVCVDADGIVVFVNDAARGIFGRAFEGCHIAECADKYEILLPDGSPCPPAQLPLARAALHGERVIDAACRVRRPDGHVVDVSATATPLVGTSGEQIGAVLIMRDVSERLALERTLAMSRRRFEALAHATAQMLWTTDAAGEVIEDSPSWRAFTGQTREDWLGRGWLDVVHPDDRERAANTWLEAVREGVSYEVEYRVRRHDGQYRWTVARGTPLRDDAGVVREWVGCNWDVHPLRAAQEELARVAEVQQMLLAIVSHDLRNPLSSILLAAALMQREEGEPRARALAARLTRAGQRALGIVDVLLDFAQAELGGGLRVDRGPCELADVCREILSEFEGATGDGAIVLRAEGATSGSWDAARLGQLVSNLVGNAVRHGSPGADIELSLEGRGDVVRLTIANKSPPLAPEVEARLFDAFKERPSGQRGGLGLGLYIVKQIAEAHGGSVRFTGSGERAEFVVELPRQAVNP